MNLSILIPARNEEFLAKTIEDILLNIEDETEIIVVLDGEWASPEVKQNDRVKVVYLPKSIGQRAATNLACKLAKGKYIMKVDAHCAFDKGFDRKLIEDMQDDWTVVPTMRNLHVFDWVCEKCGQRRYQGPSGKCLVCGGETKKDIVWISKTNPQSTSYCFDSEPHFQYFNEYKKKQEGDLVETMSLQGSCFMLSRKKYWELNICDENFGSWGSQGIEVACKTWLSGGKCIVNKKTWYAHLFRTQGGDFSFPYPQDEKKVQEAKSKARDIFFNNKWKDAKYSLSWLIEKFYPVKGWSDDDLRLLKEKENLTKGILYYTDNEVEESLMKKCQNRLLETRLPITSVSLKPLDFGNNFVLEGKRGYLTMAKQILKGLKEMKEDVVFFCEHDVLYEKSHFDFLPADRNTFYYNMNSLVVRQADGFAVCYDHKSLSGLCGYREEMIRHYEERVEMIEAEGFSRRMGFEPMTHKRIDWKNKFKCGEWKSEQPNLDIKHGKNLTKARWRKEDFRDQRNCRNWQESFVNIN